MRQRLLALALGGLFLAGCHNVKYTQTGPEYEARAPNCNFRLLFAAAPDGPYEQVGVVELTKYALGTTDIDEFRRKIGPYVCQAGGNGAIAFANGYGVYVKAVVIVIPPPPPPKKSVEAEE